MMIAIGDSVGILEIFGNFLECIAVFGGIGDFEKFFIFF